MFKLLKDLARPPEPLIAPAPQSPFSPASGDLAPSVLYAARQRARSISQGVARALETPSAQAPRDGAPAAPGPAERRESVLADELVEEDEDAKLVVQYLRSLEKAEGVMAIVETLSQLLSVPTHFLSLRSFRRHRGFSTILNVLSKALSWKDGSGNSEEEMQVAEVQRMEGVRLSLEVLGWAMEDRQNALYFEREGGYSKLLPILRRLSKPKALSEPSSSAISSGDNTNTPHHLDAQILAVLLAHVFNNNYALLGLFTPQSLGDTNTTIPVLLEKTGDLTLSWGGALPILWAYLWGQEVPVGSIKGKEKAPNHHPGYTAIASGMLEAASTERSLLVQKTFQILLAASSSTPNLFVLHTKLPQLPDFLMTRLYGFRPVRRYDVTFPATADGWVEESVAGTGSGETGTIPKPEWVKPSPELREVYLGLVRKLLEVGADQSLTWRLFSLVRTTEAARRKKDEAELRALAVSARDFAAGPITGNVTPEKKESNGNGTPQKAKRRPQLTLDASPTPPPVADMERLDTEVLDLIRHGTKARWPGMFVFRGGNGYSEGGVELRDMGRNWPTPQKGFTYSAWIYINKLNHPITLLDAQQTGKRLFRMTILENSQIALYSTSTVPGAGTATSAGAEDMICAAPDALVPHQQWIHFAVNCRKMKSSDNAEVRLYINGVRVGAMRIPYPTAATLAPPPAPHLHVKPATPADAIRLCVGRQWRGLEQDSNGEKKQEKGGASALGRGEGNEWMLGRTILLEETVTEDMILLIHHLGPRYNGNFQEPVGKFLTYEGATSINIFLSSLGQSSANKRLFTSPNTSLIVKAIRSGPAIPEDHIICSLSARDVAANQDYVVNAAVPHRLRARQLRHGIAHLVGNALAFSATGLDDSVSSVGGGTVVLKMIDMAQTSDELAAALAILRDMIKDSWSASEEMERIHGFELLAAILRPKMPGLMDVNCTKIVLAMLGINMDKPATATVHNSVAYRALGLEFEMWSYASLGITSLYLQHFQYLLVESKHRRFNLLRTFQKSAMVRKLLYALRSGFFDPAVVPVAVDTLKFALEARWSGEDAIKPIFSYLVTALCQSSGASTPVSAITPTEPPPSQAPAAQILSMIMDLSHDPQRLIKLNKSLALHRLLVVFLSSSAAYYVVVPCLDILAQCLLTPGLETFQRSFESEGGFALLAKTLPYLWREDIQATAFKILLGSDESSSTLLAPSMLSTILATVDVLVSTVSDPDEAASRPGAHMRTRSGNVVTGRSIALAPLATLSPLSPDGGDDTRLVSLLRELTAAYRTSQALRRALAKGKIESQLPVFADFAAITGSSSKPESARPQREAVAQWLEALIELSKSSSGLINQMKLIQEQLQTSYSPRPSSASFVMSPATGSPSMTSPRISHAQFGSSISRGFGTTPPPSMPGSPTGSLRRRPSTEAGQTFSRARSLIERRAPLKRVLTNESILEGGKDKNAAWKLIIIQTDSQKHSKLVLERKEHWQKLGEEQWPRQAAVLRSENGLWPEENVPVKWRLDGSEGPLRMRARLERVSMLPEQSVTKTQRKLRDAIPSVDELSSAVSRVNVAPWEDPFALALGQAAPIEEEPLSIAPPAKPTESGETSNDDRNQDDDSFIEVEDDKDDKMRRIAKTLEAGDVVEEAHNIVRIVGVDACPGLLIIGKRNLYLMDNLVQTPDGAVIDAKDAPKDVLTIPSGTLVELDASDSQSHRWSYNEVVESNKRAFLFRDVALELYFSDKRNFLIVFRDRRQRQNFMQKLMSKNEQRDAISRSVIGNFVLDTVAKAIDKSELQLEAMTKRWQQREISNFAYLQLLNQHANRTPNDVTQYPVFPWVLADYNSVHLDLDREATFRNLSLPMGAQTPARREAALERYSATEGVGEKPFHYGTHYSSSMIVCGYMIRSSPFTEIFLALQGGNFDLADRLFSSIPRAWDSASSDNRGDVRELIPEFYYSPSFLTNMNHHDFGKKQVTGDTVDDVALPAWALGDPALFIHRHREALESDYVSRHLPAWIDLTFGYKQRDASHYNCFHPLSYRGAVDLERMTDENEKAASTAIIHNFGQTPEQIFKMPHPSRYLSGKTTLPYTMKFGVAEGWQLLLRSILPITETIAPIDDLLEPYTPEGKPSTQQENRIAVPGQNLTVQYGYTDDSLRVYYQEPTSSVTRLIHIMEGVSVTHAIFAAPTLLITVAGTGVLTAWRLSIKNYGYRRGDVTIQREATLTGHTSRVTCLAASTSWSLLVSGAEDGTAIVWDTNRMRYTRTMQTTRSDPIKFCTIHEADGKIAIATRRDLYIFSLNGHPFVHTTLDDEEDTPYFNFGSEPIITKKDDEFTGGIAFLNREFLKFGPLFVVGIGSEVALYRCIPGSKYFEEQEVKPWTLEEQGRLHRSDDHPGGDCSMVKFVGETLYAAFKPGNGATKHSLYQWSLPEGNARHVSELVSGTCMAEKCGRHFGLLEPRRHCGGCGGAFCGTHAVHVEQFSQRYCETCRAQLAQAHVLGILSQRRDSVMPSSRRGSIARTSKSPSNSRSGSRRPSISRGPGGTSASGSPSAASTATVPTTGSNLRPPPPAISTNLFTSVM